MKEDHKLIEHNEVHHMDCLEGMKLIADKSIDMILTDIPYGNVTKNGENRSKYDGQLRKIDKGKADIVTFNLGEFLQEISRISNGGIYIFCGIEQLSPIFEFFDREKDFMVRQCAWKKTNPSPANGQHMWLSSMENCVFAKRRKTKFNANCKSAVWEFPTGRSKVHPTQKPLKMFEYLIEASSDVGDTVLDTCMGSGTTAVACEKLGRKWIGFETEKEYIEMTNNRLEELRCISSI